MPASDINNRVKDFCKDYTLRAVLLVILACELLWVAAPWIVRGGK
jgi:hypothetical protein